MNHLAAERRRLQSLSPEDLEQHQLARLNALCDQILPHNAFYAEKLADISRPVRSLDELESWPYTFKEELQSARASGELAANLTFERSRYVRYHQTSGTRGRPLTVLDTAEDWRWWTGTWQFVYDRAGVEPGDRVFLAFSFGPFIGFWSAYDAAFERGCLAIPGGGMTSLARLELMRASGATVLCCTPSYALHLVESASSRQMNASDLGVKTVIVAGEPGGSVPAIRDRIESLWGAKVVDHSGSTEVGPWGYADVERRGLQVLECEFIPEFLSVDAGGPAAEGELAELVLTCLGRTGCPIIRYRTGDLVRPVWQHNQATRFVLLEGGVLGRVDDMLIIRGMNVFPSAIEQILRGFPEVLEYRMTARKDREMDHLSIEIEDRLEAPARVAEELHLRLGLKIDVHSVEIGSLPRFEGKGQRFVDLR